MPVEAFVDEQTAHVGLILFVAQKPDSHWVRPSLERHTARVELPFDVARRPVRDVKPLRPPSPRGASGCSGPRASHF